MLKYVIGIACVILLLFAWRTVLWQPRSLPAVNSNTPWLIGHRGVIGKAPENTLAAFALAFDAGLDGVEADVLRTMDGRLILFHDAEIEGQAVNSLSLSELRAIKPDIPVLEELFVLAKDYPATLLNIELKSTSIRTDGLEREVVKAIGKADISERVLISSFNPVSILRIRLLAPDLRVGLLYGPEAPSYLRSGGSAPWLHVDAIHPHESQVDVELIRRAKARGLMVNTWTVNDPMRITSLSNLGVSAIIGDDPSVLCEAASRECIRNQSDD